MSRIHEALKKAEAEAALLNGKNDNSTVVAIPAVATLENETMAAAPETSVRPICLDLNRKEWVPDAERMIFWRGDEQTVEAEQFRTLRSRLFQLRDQRVLKTVLMSSAVPGEGKSFVSANLAQVLARREKARVLLIDADLRWPRLHGLLGASSSPGLGDYLRGGADEQAIIQTGPIANLAFIPGGSRLDNPAELLSNGKMPELLTRLSQQFDWIIVDSPALGPVSDGLQLAAMCDAALMVVRSGVTPLDAAQRACQELKRKRLLGVVLNGVSAANAGDDYYTGYYGGTARRKRNKERMKAEL